MNSPETTHIEARRLSLDSTPGEPIRELTLARPKKRNALHVETIRSFTRLLESVVPGDGSAVVIRAQGEDFCLGADITSLDPESLEDPAAVARVVQNLVMSLRECPLPVVAGVQGRVYGLGVHICLGADLVVAEEGTSFAVPEADLGLPVAGFVTSLLPQLIGERRARHWLFTGADIGTEAAAEAGFVTMSATEAAFEETLHGLLSQLDASSSAALAALKSQLASLEHPGRDQAAAVEQAAMRSAYEEGDAVDRIGRLLN